MTARPRIELPTQSGAYRWYYADVVAGDVTAVFIFMVGSIFSARYSASLKTGGLPQQHAAVNFALYRRGIRSLWVLSEYQSVCVEDESNTLRIGRSSLRYTPTAVTFHIDDQTTPFGATRWGRRTEATLTLTPTVLTSREVQLVEGRPHFWQPIMARADATLTLSGQPSAIHGHGYHDSNHGEAPLGTDVRGWHWARTHSSGGTQVVYRLTEATHAWYLHAEGRAVELSLKPHTAMPTRRSKWGLHVPREMGIESRPHLLESSPFYARLEAHRGDMHALGEVANFERFHQPNIRWMSLFKTRQAGVA